MKIPENNTEHQLTQHSRLIPGLEKLPSHFGREENDYHFKQEAVEGRVTGVLLAVRGMRGNGDQAYREGHECQENENPLHGVLDGPTPGPVASRAEIRRGVGTQGRPRGSRVVE